MPTLEARSLMEMIGWCLLGAALLVALPDGHGPGKCKSLTSIERTAYRKAKKQKEEDHDNWRA